MPGSNRSKGIMARGMSSHAGNVDIVTVAAARYADAAPLRDGGCPSAGPMRLMASAPVLGSG